MGPAGGYPGSPREPKQLDIRLYHSEPSSTGTRCGAKAERERKLYDYRTDPREPKNLAKESSAQELKAKLRARLDATLKTRRPV